MLVGVPIAVTCKVPRNSGKAYFGEMKQCLSSSWGWGPCGCSPPVWAVSSVWQWGWDNSVLQWWKRGVNWQPLTRTRGGKQVLGRHEQRPCCSSSRSSLSRRAVKCHYMSHPQLPLPDWKRAKDCFTSTCWVQKAIVCFSHEYHRKQDYLQDSFI